jgi:hypothetical protein
MIRNVFIIGETEKAYLLKFCSSKKTQWFPKTAVVFLDITVNNMTGRKTYKADIVDKFIKP